jgi:hypothetical protein
MDAKRPLGTSTPPPTPPAKRICRATETYDSSIVAVEETNLQDHEFSFNKALKAANGKTLLSEEDGSPNRFKVLLGKKHPTHNFLNMSIVVHQDTNDDKGVFLAMHYFESIWAPIFGSVICYTACPQEGVSNSD